MIDHLLDYGQLEEKPRRSNNMRLPIYNFRLATRLLQIIVQNLLSPIFRHITNPRFRSAVMGVLLGLLMIASMLEVLLLYIFGIIRLALVVILVSFGGAEVLCWLLSDIPKTDEAEAESPKSDEIERIEE